MVVYIQCKFHELPSIGYLVMAEDRKMDRWMEKPEGWTDGMIHKGITYVTFLTTQDLSVYVKGLRLSNLIRCWAVASVNSPGSGCVVPRSTETKSTPAFSASP